MRDAVARLGGTLDLLPPELDVSGGLPLSERPSLLRAVEGVEAGRYRGIVIAYQSRLFRNVEEEEATWRRVEAAGGRIEMALDGLDTATVDGRMLRRIRASMNAAERERHAQRFAQLAEWATGNGIWQRRQTPIGYDRDPDTRGLVPNDDAPRVVQAFRDRAQGVPISQIATRLGMTTSGVRAMLRNRVFLGELHVAGHVNLTSHPPLVTVDDYERAQVHIARPARRAGEGPALLTGLVRCQACGHIMTRRISNYEVYVCGGRFSGGRCPQPTAATTAKLDEHVLGAVLPHVLQVEVTATAQGRSVEDARRAVVTAQRELAAYVDAVSAADVGAVVFADGARSRRDRLADAQAELQRRIAARPALAALEDGLDSWDRMDGHAQNQLLRGLLEVVVVRSAGRGFRGPLDERVRIILAGSGFPVPRKRGSDPLGIVELPFPDLDDDHVLRVPRLEDGL